MKIGIRLTPGCGLGYWNTRSITRPLGRVVRTLEAVARGDLSVQAQVHSRDEVGQVAASAQQMVSNLQERAKLADSVASGDLSVSVKLLSDKDVLGLALEKMVASMRERAALADQIANGNLQDEASCVVFGMPAEAIKLDGVDQVLPLERIAAEVVRRCR